MWRGLKRCPSTGASQRRTLRECGTAARKAGSRAAPVLGPEGGAGDPGRWIYATMFGPGAPRGLERDLVEDGRLEVDAPPPGRDRWGDGHLVGNLRDLNGHRWAPVISF